MAVNDHNGQVLTSKSKNPPKHYRLSIKSFSSLTSEEKYESGEFEAGGYKWKLVLFPNGNKDRGVKDNISLYLKMGGKDAIKAGKIVTIDYKLFLLYRHNGKEKYRVLEEPNKKEKKYCFYKTIVGCLAGFDLFIPLDLFRDTSEGYLIDDRCEFGAEVFVSETTRIGKGECLFMNLDTDTYKYVWKLNNFSTLNAPSCYSTPFCFANHKYCTMKLQLYPKGNGTGNGSHLSLFLWLNNPDELPPGSKILAGFTLRILDQILGNHCSYKADKACWFDAANPNFGRQQMITQEENARFSMDDSCIIEVEVTIQGVSVPGI
ncbi:hypothetical protein ACLB2K_021486 [Fragaria x ananassa]